MKRNLSKAFISVLLVLGIALSLCVPALGAEASTPERHGYTTITESDVKYVYDLLLTEVSKSTPTAKITFDDSKHISKSELEKAVALFVSDYPEFFWFRNYYSYLPVEDIPYISPTYSFSGSALTEAKKAFNEAVSEIMGGLPSGSSYDKALYLHDALAKRVEYVQEGEHQTAYGALVAGKAVCAGYAAAYQLLLQEAGIKAWTVTGHSQVPGSTQQIAHAWNLVWLDSDTCVYTDVTWDDQGDETYRYYFNLSKSEIHADHVTNTDIFTLPACNHSDKSYFDVNSTAVVNDSTSAQDVAALFGPTVDGKRNAVIYYDGSDLNSWLGANSGDIYEALDGGAGSYTYSYGAMGKEIHLCFEGNFPTTAYTLNVFSANRMFTYGEEYQLVTIGQPMTELVYTASAGYYFPENYSVTPVKGVSVTRKSSSQISVSGTPTGNVTLMLTAPTAMPKEATPAATFRATGDDCGLLSGVESGMKYSLDGESWTAVTSAKDIELTGLSEGNIYVIRVGNGETTRDSESQVLTIAKPSAPTLTVTQPAAEGDKGSINTDSTHEYSTDGESWTPCTGRLDGLEAGKYYVRVKATGSALASEAQELTVNAYGKAPSQDGNENGGALPNGGQEGNSNPNNGGSPNVGDTPNGENNNTLDGENNNTLDSEDKNDTGKTTAKNDGSGFDVDLGCGLTLDNGGAILLALVIFIGCLLLKKKQSFNNVK